MLRESCGRRQQGEHGDEASGTIALQGTCRGFRDNAPLVAVVVAMVEVVLWQFFAQRAA